MQSRMLLALIVAAGLATGFIGAAKAQDMRRNPFAPPPPKWTATAGLQASQSKATQRSSPSKTNSLSGSLSLMYQLDDETFLGGNLAYTNSEIKAGFDNGRGDSDAYAGGLFGMRMLEPGLLLDAALGYGSVALDNRYNNGAAIRYDADTIFWSGSIGLTKLFPLSPTLTASLSARYTVVRSRTDDYADSAGNRTDAKSSELHYVSPGGGLYWRLGAWEPYVNAAWNLANRDFTDGVKDNNYFSVGFGTNYVLTDKTSLSAGFNTMLGKAEAQDRSVMISVISKF